MRCYQLDKFCSVWEHTWVSQYFILNVDKTFTNPPVSTITYQEELAEGFLSVDSPYVGGDGAGVEGCLLGLQGP